MAKVYFSEVELDALYAARGAAQPVAYTLRPPLPQMFLVTADPQLGEAGISVRTTTLTPLSWGPYTKAVNIPRDDVVVVRNLSEPRAQCVLGLPTRDQLRKLTICAQRLPRGISEVTVARFVMCRSLYVDVPSIDDCPVNFECAVEHLEPHYTHLIAFLRVVGASIDDAVLYRERDEIVSLYPTNAVDVVEDERGTLVERVSLISDLYLCPTFPVAPKRGWYGTFDLWMRDLLEEEYLNRDEYEQVIAWHERWQAVFSDLDSLERAQLRENLTELIRLIARERWAEVRVLLANSRVETRF